MLLRRLEGAAMGVYGPPEVPLPLSVIPERLIYRKATEGGGKILYLAFLLSSWLFAQQSSWFM